MFAVNYVIETSLLRRFVWRVLNSISGSPLDPFRVMEAAVLALDAQWQHAWNDDRLTPERVAQLIKGVDWNVYEQDVKDKRSVFESRPIESSMQGLAVPLVREVLRRDPAIKTILEIGANY